MEITLKINGEDKTFVQEFIPGKFKRKSLEVEKYASKEGADEIELYDKRLNLVVEIFGKQFTKDELENGMNAPDIDTTFYNVIGVGILNYPTIEEQEQLGKEILEMQNLQQTSSTTESAS